MKLKCWAGCKKQAPPLNKSHKQQDKANQLLLKPIKNNGVLMQYEINKRYRLLGFGAKISDSYRQKLLSLGLLPGISFQIKHIAPLGNPIAIETRYGTFMVRRQDLSDLETEFTV